MLIHRNHRHFHLMPTYRPFFNDYLPHSLSKWALHPRLLRAHNFIGTKKSPPPILLLWSQNVFWICWLCIRTSMETRSQVLAFIIFHRDKTKQQREGRGGGQGEKAWWEEMRKGRWLSRTILPLPMWQCVSIRKHFLIRFCVLLIKIADLPTTPLLPPSLSSL